MEGSQIPPFVRAIIEAEIEHRHEADTSPQTTKSAFLWLQRELIRLTERAAALAAWEQHLLQQSRGLENEARRLSSERARGQHNKRRKTANNAPGPAK